MDNRKEYTQDRPFTLDEFIDILQTMRLGYVVAQFVSLNGEDFNTIEVKQDGTVNLKGDNAS